MGEIFGPNRKVVIMDLLNITIAVVNSGFLSRVLCWFWAADFGGPSIGVLIYLWSVSFLVWAFNCTLGSFKSWLWHFIFYQAGVHLSTGLMRAIADMLSVWYICPYLRRAPLRLAYLCVWRKCYSREDTRTGGYLVTASCLPGRPGSSFPRQSLSSLWSLPADVSVHTVWS